MTSKSRDSVPCVDGIPDYVSWPTPGKEVEVNRTVLKNVADQLNEDLKKFTDGSPGTAYDIRGHCGKLSDAQFGSYTGGKAMAGSNKAAANHIDTALGQLLNSYRQIIDSLEKATKDYRDADDRVQQAADRIKPESF